MFNPESVSNDFIKPNLSLKYISFYYFFLCELRKVYLYYLWYNCDKFPLQPAYENIKQPPKNKHYTYIYVHWYITYMVQINKVALDFFLQKVVSTHFGSHKIP